MPAPIYPDTVYDFMPHLGTFFQKLAEGKPYTFSENCMPESVTFEFKNGPLIDPNDPVIKALGSPSKVGLTMTVKIRGRYEFYRYLGSGRWEKPIWGN